MAKSKPSKAGATPPLTADELRKTEIVPLRHPVAPAALSATARFDLGGTRGDDAPAVSTRLVRSAGRKGGWQVEVSVDGGQLRPAHPDPVEVVQVDRAELARAGVAYLPASMPEGKEKVAVRPKRRKLPAPYTIRFGDLEYEPTTIFRPDGRGPYYDTNYPYRCLVRMTNPRGWSGSGVLIGPRHVVTASHCVDWTPGWLTVDVMYTNGSSLASANGVLIYAESKVGPGSIPDSQSDEDYAVVVLDQPLGATYGWYGCRTYDSGWDNSVSSWCNIGYPQDFDNEGDVATFQTNFFLDELGADFGSARLIRSQTFDNWPGQSGSPIFGFWPEGPFVVGIVSGQRPDFNYISGGSLLPSLVTRALNENP